MERAFGAYGEDSRTTERSTKDSARRHGEYGMSRMTKWSCFDGAFEAKNRKCDKTILLG